MVKTDSMVFAVVPPVVVESVSGRRHAIDLNARACAWNKLVKSRVRTHPSEEFMYFLIIVYLGMASSLGTFAPHVNIEKYENAIDCLNVRDQIVDNGTMGKYLSDCINIEQFDYEYLPEKNNVY